MLKQCLAILGASLCLAPSLAQSQGLPADVRPNHWAVPSVKSALQNRLLALDGKAFRGEAKATRTEAIVAIANLVRALDTKTWVKSSSVALPASAEAVADQGAWQKQPVTRYALARILARAGDYFANGIQRLPANAKKLAKSTSVPEKATLTLPKTHPAYASLSYLVSKRAVWTSSPLLNPDNKPVTAVEVAKALAQAIVGLNDAVTELGHEEDGSTPDRSFRNKKP